MESPDPQILSTPGIDIQYYFDKTFSGLVNFFHAHGWDFWAFAKSALGAVVGISIPIALFFIIMLVITVESLKRIRQKEEEMFMKPPAEPKKEVKANEEQARRWKKVLEHVNSENQNDWKQAIIEADVMLEQLVTNLGYQGESLGEKLKRTVKGDFKSRDQAWEAHLVRNRIAHDGSAYEISQFEAKRVIGLYRLVFDEFYHISEQ